MIPQAGLRATLAEWQRDHGMRSRTPKAVQIAAERRLARYAQVCELHAAGKSDSAIVRALGLDRRTVRKFWSPRAFPERVVRTKVSSATSPFRTYLRDRVAQGCLNAATLFREIEPQGYAGLARVAGPGAPLVAASDGYDDVRRLLVGARRQRFGHSNAHAFQSLVKRGLACAEDWERFGCEQFELNEQGRYFYNITGYAYVGRRAGHDIGNRNTVG